LSATIAPATALAPEAQPDHQRASTVSGTLGLVRFMLRRDRIRLPLWILGIGVTQWLMAASFPSLYPDEASRVARATIMQSPAAIALGGPFATIDDYTLGTMMTNEMLGMTTIFVAIMSIFTMVRHTRADEESGRADLVLAAPVGRHAPLAAAFCVTVLANLVLLVLTAVLLGSLGIETITWSGSWLYASALVSVGFVFAGVAGVTAQLASHARTASSLAGLLLGLAYAVRAVGDVTGSDLSWSSPIAWAQRAEAYFGDRWWPLLLSLAATTVLIGVTAFIASHRDIGSGVLTPRPGPATASARLVGPFSLAWRLERVAFIAWFVSLLSFGLVYGTLLGEVKTFTGDLAKVESVLAAYGGQLLDAFLSLLVVLLSMTASIFAILAVLRARIEEETARAEPVLASPVSRVRWISSHLCVAAVGGVAVLFAGALGVGVSGTLTDSGDDVLGKMLQGGLAQIAPVLLMVGVTMLLYGWWPRAATAVWVLLVGAFFINTFGGLLQLPDWMIDISPFTIVPVLPGEAFRLGPFLAVLAAALLCTGLGVLGLRRRDLSAN
jgi:ABC-2 type transport system permease protein